MDSVEFRIAVTKLLGQLGSRFTEEILRRDTKECRNAIYADNIAHGEHIEDPFFNFVVHDVVAAFTFFESEFAIYAFRCNESELISEAGRFALSDKKIAGNFWLKPTTRRFPIW